MRQTRLAIFCTFFALAIDLVAQPKQPPTPADYGQWETLVDAGGGGGRGGPSTGGLSPDGKWLTYGINRSNGNNELRVADIAAGTTKTTAFGTQPAYSDDSRWVAFSIGYSEAQQERMRKDNKPVQNKLGLLNLATGEQTVIEGIQSFAFSPTGAWIAMRHYPPEAAGGAGAGRGAPAGGRGGGGRGGAGANGQDDNTPGATLIVRQLATGRDMTFGNVSEFAWQDVKHKGTLLAMAISTTDKTGNGVQLFDSQTGTLRVLDSSASTYSNLAWRKDGADLAALRSKTDDKHDGPAQMVLAWRHLGEASEDNHTYDPTADTKFPAGLRTVTFRRPSWSDDAKTVYVGLAEWYPKPPSAGRGGRGGRGEAAGDSKEDAKETEEAPDVDVWHWRDYEVMAHQVKNAAQNGRRSMLAAWHPDSGALTQLGKSITEQVTPFKHRNLAWAAEWKEYALERSIGRPAADIYLIDPASGQRTKMKDKLTEDHYLQLSAGGKYLLYLENDQYWAVDVATRAAVNITKGIKTSFIDDESDATVKQKPPFGVAGWTKDDAAVILYDKFDLWKVAPDGSKAARLTDGAGEQVRHRYVRLDPDEEFIDLDKPVYLSLFGIWSKKSGYAMLKPGASAPERLMWADKSIERLSKASNAPVYEYVSESAEESPNAYVGGAGLQDARRITDTNPFQSKYAWTHSELIEYKSSTGRRLQGVLSYPMGYEPGKKYPMVVYMYEKLSDGLHRYNSPSERSYYSANAITSHGYFLLQPDIVFTKREPGVSVADCVTAAVKKVLEKGAVDEKKVGVVGHSWGGFDASFLATHTHIFAAAVAGAPITDLISNYGDHHWSSGIAETDHIETGQQRMEVPLYEDLQAYIRNSAVFGVSTMTTPLLIEVGDADGTVFYHQGVELYNIARRARKNVVLLVYGGEDHGLRKKADQVDYQHRIFAWFDYYLKGATPPTPWIIEGESYLDHQRNLKQTKVE